MDDSKHSLIHPGLITYAVATHFIEFILCLENKGEVCSRPQQGRAKICTR
jgi:hypothetical protein